MTTATEFFAALCLTVIGLSHVLQPRVWVDFFTMLREKGRAGVFVNGFLSLNFGAFIVAFHNVWQGLPIVLTLLGWAQVIKGLLSFVAPQIAMRGMARVAPERAWEFVAAGFVMLAVGGLLWYVALAG